MKNKKSIVEPTTAIIITIATTIITLTQLLVAWQGNPELVTIIIIFIGLFLLSLFSFQLGFCEQESDIVIKNKEKIKVPCYREKKFILRDYLWGRLYFITCLALFLLVIIRLIFFGLEPIHFQEFLHSPQKTVTQTITATFSKTPLMETETPKSNSIKSTNTTLESNPTSTHVISPVQSPTSTIYSTFVHNTGDNSCYRARYISEGPPYDNSELNVNSKFEKTWRIKNIGNCTWDESVKLSWIGSVVNPDKESELSKELFGQSTPMDMIDKPVEPGGYLDIKIEFIVPQVAEPTTFQLYFALETPTGLVDIDDAPLWFKIQAIPIEGQNSQDFESNFQIINKDNIDRIEQIDILPRGRSDIGFPYDIQFTPDSKYILAGSDIGYFRVWRLSDREVFIIKGSHDKSVLSVSNTIKDKDYFIATGSISGVVEYWKFNGDLINDKEECFQLIKSISNPPSSPIWDLSLSKDNILLAIATREDKVYLWQTKNHLISDSRSNYLSSIFGDIKNIDFSPSGDKVSFSTVTNKNKIQIYIWQIVESIFNGEPIILSVSDIIQAIKFSPDGKNIAFGDNNGVINIYDVENYQKEYSLKGKMPAVKYLSFSPNGELIISTYDDGSVRIWIINNNSYEELFFKNMNAINAEFSPNGKYIGVGLKDGRVTLWGITK